MEFPFDIPLQVSLQLSRSLLLLSGVNFLFLMLPAHFYLYNLPIVSFLAPLERNIGISMSPNLQVDMSGADKYILSL
jgi:hypothetical protein